MQEVGNTKYARSDKQIQVYDGKTLQVKASIVIPDDTVINNETMSEHFIKFSFHLNARIWFKRTDYIIYDGITYRLREECQPTEVSSNHYTYELRFDAPEMLFQDCIMFYTMQGYKEVEWVLFGKASQFIEIAADNISSYLGEEWKSGIIDPGDFETQNITFNGQNVFDALTVDIAEAFACEWYVDYALKTINLVYKREYGDAIPLRRETELIDIKKAKDSELEYCTRLYAFGSTRNIPKNYRNIDNGGVIDAIVQKKLRLPVGVGDYIDAFPNVDNLQIIESVKVFEDIYPKRIGTITSMRTVEKKDEDGNPFIIYYIKDSGLQFKSSYILPNETLMLQFVNNSWLNGRSFELSYNDKTEEFEIINITEGENYLPNDILRPKVGDEYVLYGFDISLVGDQYVPEAEIELEAAAREYLKTIATDTSTYTCTVNSVYRFENNLDLSIGQKVVLKSLIFDEGEKESRIYGYRKYPVTGKDEYVIGDVMDYKRLARMENETEENKKIADVQFLEAMKLANGSLKNAKALGYLRRALENETSIDGGLILTTLIRLGAMIGTEWKESAGVNGINEGDNDVAFWAGGTLDQAVNAANDPNRIDDIAQFVVTHLGKLIANDIFARGTLETNDSGNRVTMDSERRALLLIDKDGNEAGILRLNASINGYSAQLILSSESEGQFGDSVLSLSAGGLNTHSVKTGHTAHLSQGKLDVYNNSGSGFHVDCIDSSKKLKVILENLPTENEWLDSGQLWLDDGVLKIVN